MAILIALHIATIPLREMLSIIGNIYIKQCVVSHGTDSAFNESLFPYAIDNQMDLLRDFFERFSRAATFANTDNLGDALRLMRALHLDEIDRRQAQARQQSASRLAQRPPLLHHRVRVTSPSRAREMSRLQGAH